MREMSNGWSELLTASCKNLRRRKNALIEAKIRPLFFRSKVKHLHGPRQLRYGHDELLVTSVVRNGEFYVRSFMDHYLSLGATHFVFLDNGSTDRTVEMLCRHENVTVLQTDAIYYKYENTMKRYLAEEFSMGSWHLCSDIDEHFDYPYSEFLRLRDFLRYLNQRRYTAVIAQVLDMFSDQPLAQLDSKSADRLEELHQYYDLSDIVRLPIVEALGVFHPTLDNAKLNFHRGGIRKALFGTDSGLSKESLIMMDGKVQPYVSWHWTKNARVADISCVLKHYPFLSSFYTKVREAVISGRYGRFTADYVAYKRALDSSGSFCLMRETARKLENLEQLIDEGFLTVSEMYVNWVATHRRQLRS